MTTPQDSSLSTNNNAPTEQEDHPITTVVSRLRDANVDLQRFIQLRPGSKRAIDHTQYMPGEVGSSYGIYAGNSLVFVDIDDYKQGVKKPDKISDLPETFTVCTPHSGTHLYYLTDEEVDNRSPSWGEIRADNQYVVGPGTQLKNCDKNHHDCSRPQEGTYEIIKDQSIRYVDQDILRSIFDSTHSDSNSNSNTTQQSRNLSPVAKEPENIDFSAKSRREKMFRSKPGEKIKKLWRGQYQKAGHNDRSTAEAALVSYLGFWMNGNKRIVRNLMNKACREYPESDLDEGRKWIEGEDIYQKQLLQVSKHLHYYKPASPSQPYDERPKVSWVTEHLVFGALLDIEPARTTQIVDHHLIDRDKRQIQNCLTELEDRNVIQWEREGRNTYYKIVY